MRPLQPNSRVYLRTLNSSQNFAAKLDFMTGAPRSLANRASHASCRYYARCRITPDLQRTWPASSATSHIDRRYAHLRSFGHTIFSFPFSFPRFAVGALCHVCQPQGPERRSQHRKCVAASYKFLRGMIQNPELAPNSSLCTHDTSLKRILHPSRRNRKFYCVIPSTYRLIIGSGPTTFPAPSPNGHL